MKKIIFVWIIFSACQEQPQKITPVIKPVTPKKDSLVLRLVPVPTYDPFTGQSGTTLAPVWEPYVPGEN